MKKIINGKLYDTETAREVGSWTNGLGYNDIHFIRRTLYKKKTGEFFSHEEVGSSGLQDIIPLSLQEAKRFAETFLTVEEYIETFGEVEE